MAVRRRPPFEPMTTSQLPGPIAAGAVHVSVVLFTVTVMVPVIGAVPLVLRFQLTVTGAPMTDGSGVSLRMVRTVGTCTGTMSKAGLSAPASPSAAATSV